MADARPWLQCRVRGCSHAKSLAVFPVGNGCEQYAPEEIKERLIKGKVVAKWITNLPRSAILLDG